MHKIWDRKSFEVGGDIGRCGGDEKNEWPRRTDKSCPAFLTWYLSRQKDKWNVLFQKINIGYLIERQWI